MLGRLPWFAFERRIFAFFFFVFFDMVDKPNGPLVTFPLPAREAPPERNIRRCGTAGNQDQCPCCSCDAGRIMQSTEASAAGIQLSKEARR